MSRLMVISNRISMPETRAEAGGLAVAINEALKESGGIWCGWSGKRSPTPQVEEKTYHNIRYITTDFTRQDYKEFYLGFCNAELWPLFHYRLGLTRYQKEMFEGYQRVNRHFAELAARAAKKGDRIWVHDYQLILLGAYLRELGVKERIGFFLHIPFPVPEVYVALPHYMELLKGLCAYDLVGFQTESDLQAFLRCLTELAGAHTRCIRSGIHEVQAFGRRFRAGCFPISIDTAHLEKAAARSAATAKIVNLQKSLGGRSMLIGVDRLDYTKGLSRRLEAFGHFLTTNPDYRNRVSYIQIAPPTRTEVVEYGVVREQLERLAAHINGVHAEIDWVPIRYINRSFTRGERAGFYRVARVGVVTPLRDGMNLVAKEYVACQNPQDPGVLLLSRFAGAVGELIDGAVVVNPYDAEDTAMKMRIALEMSAEERKERWQAMMGTLRRQDIFCWTKQFLHYLAPEEPRKEQELPRAAGNA
jgi:trehalose 6-phosphate synthase